MPETTDGGWILDDSHEPPFAKGPVELFDPEQPRVAAGSSDGGQWAATGAGRAGRAVADRSDDLGSEPIDALPPAVARRIAEFESLHADDPTESGLGVLPSGRVALDKTDSGTEGYIKMSDRDVALVRNRDVVFTHNHPNDTSFSYDDVSLAARLNLREVRAVTRPAVYRMRPGPEGWPDRDALLEVYEKHHDRAKRLVQARISKGEIRTPDQANQVASQMIWPWVAREFPDSLIYAREPRHA